jgi:hypothetical protein
VAGVCRRASSKARTSSRRQQMAWADKRIAGGNSPAALHRAKVALLTPQRRRRSAGRNISRR